LFLERGRSRPRVDVRKHRTVDPVDVTRPRSLFKMKIAVVGCGALGSYYGAKLCRDGQEVHFLLRSDFEIVRRRGVFVRSPEGNFHVNPKCARAPEQIGACDLVLIGLKTTANDQFPKLLPPLLGKHTAVSLCKTAWETKSNSPRCSVRKRFLVDFASFA
jgi:hypothetical protein